VVEKHFEQLYAERIAGHKNSRENHCWYIDALLENTYNNNIGDVHFSHEDMYINIGNVSVGNKALVATSLTPHDLLAQASFSTAFGHIGRASVCILER
jgi:hypothetical protein